MSCGKYFKVKKKRCLMGLFLPLGICMTTVGHIGLRFRGVEVWKQRIWSSDWMSLKTSNVRKWNGQMLFFSILQKHLVTKKISTALMIAPTRLFCIYENRLICLFLFTSIKDIELAAGLWLTPRCCGSIQTNFLWQTAVPSFAQFRNISPSLLLW